jgi:hypothetical protein
MSDRYHRLLRPVQVVVTMLVFGALAIDSSNAATPRPPHSSASAKITAPANDVFGIGAGTAHGLDTTRSSLNFQMDPSASLSDHIALVNIGAKPLRIAVYAADGTTTATGAVGYGSRAEPGNGARSWITFGPAKRSSLSVLVKPRSTSAVPISISPPKNATPGDHLVGVFASITAKARVRGAHGASPDIEQRVALRTFVRITGKLRSALSVHDLTASYHGSANPVGTGSTTVSYTVTNTGNVSLGAQQALSVNGLFGGTGSVPSLSAVPVLLPGSSYPVKVKVPGVRPEIFMHAKVTLTPEGVTGSVDPRETPFATSASFFAVPWVLLGVLVVLLALIVFGILWRRAHPPNARHQRRGAPKVLVSSGKV